MADRAPGAEEDGKAAGAPGAWPMLRLALVAAGCGAATGVIGGAFRRWLLTAGAWRVSLIDSVRHWPGGGWWVVPVVVACCAAVARLIVRFVPLASGSGIQEVEERWRADDLNQPWTILPAKFAGALIAIGGGLDLGREGPTVHMGAMTAEIASRRLRLSRSDERVLQAALGGAGLAVAFNAPLGGSLFVFEEVTRSFRLRLTLATLVATAVAVGVARTITGNRPDFLVHAPATPSAWLIVFYLVFGLLTGALGVLYNRLILAGLDLFARFGRVPPEARAAVVGAVVGLVLWAATGLDGGAEQLGQRLLGGGIAGGVLWGYLAAMFLLGPLSYSIGAPGGLFAPLLVVGALWGAAVHAAAHPLIPALGQHPTALAVVGMTAFFAAVVRAPLTGIALIVEMTAVTTLLVPMFAACFGATLIATLLRGEPIYDSLRRRLPGSGH